MTTVLIRRNASNDSCHNLTALMPRCTKTSFLLTPHYICSHRNSDNLHNAIYIGHSLVARVMADEHLIKVEALFSLLDPHWELNSAVVAGRAAFCLTIDCIILFIHLFIVYFCLFIYLFSAFGQQ